MRGRGNLSVSVGDLTGNEFLDDGSIGGLGNRAFSKDLKVRKLEQRNVKLQQQIIKIEQALAASQQKTHYGIRLPQIKGDVIRKQLENAYKMIKAYEYEINKRKKMDFEDSYVQQLRKYQRVLKEKEDLSNKLRKQIAQTKKASVDYTRLLKNDTLKRQHIEHQAKINADIKWLHEKIKRTQAKKQRLNTNLQKQQTQIQKMEKQLSTKYEYDKNAIENLRNRIFNATGLQHQTKEEESDEQLEPIEERDDFIIDQRTPETYGLMMAEVKLYRKLQNDYEEKLQLLTQQKQQAEDRNFQSLCSSSVIQQIEKLESAIAELKKQINPKALIPTKMDLIVQQKRRYSSSVKITKPKITMAHAFRFVEVGEATKAGKRFIDRTAIGKRPAKIVGVTFYQNKEGEPQLLGLRVTYLVGNSQKKGLINILSDISQCQANEYNLEAGDFIKSVDCMTNEKGRVVGVSMVSVRNVIIKGGMMTASRHPLAMGSNEYPVCFYGCLLPDGVEMLGVEFVSEQ